MSKTKYDELIVFLVRKTGWTLDYIRQLPVDDIALLVEELEYQEKVAEYRIAYNFAFCLANWASAQGRRKYTPEQFIGEMPQRKVEEADIWKAAQEAGIRVPAKRA